MTKLNITTLAMTVALAACASPAQGPGTGLVPRGVASTKVRHKAPSASGAILYVTGENFTTMLSYPKLKFIGKLMPETSYGQGCPDPVTGNIFFKAIVTGAATEILEFAYGASAPTATIAPPKGYYVGDCSADPTTGNVAFTYQSETDGYIAIFLPGATEPVTYSDPNMKNYADCGYDSHGNLFVNGLSTKDQYLLAELPAGSATFTDLSLSGSTSLGPILWDGANIVLEVGGNKRLHVPMTLDRVKVAGSTATIVGKTKLKYAKGAVWIDGHTVIAGRLGGGENERYVAFYKYPKGGKPKSIFKNMPPTEVYAFAVFASPSDKR